MLGTILDIVGVGERNIKTVQQSLLSRSLFRVLYGITYYISGGICAIHSWAPSSVLGYLVTFPKFLGHLQESLDEGFNYTFDHQDILRITLPGLTHLRVKEGTGTFFKAPSFGGIWSCRGGSGRWNRGQIPGDRYWQLCTAIPEKHSEVCLPSLNWKLMRPDTMSTPHYTTD